MELWETSGLSGGSSRREPSGSQSAVDSGTPERLESILEALTAHASVVLLVGDGGTGKSRLALEAADALAERIGEEVAVIALTPPADPRSGVATHFGYHFPEILSDNDSFSDTESLDIDDTAKVASRLEEAVQERSGGGVPLVVAPGIDEYSPLAATLLDRLVRSRKCRLIATARRVSGAAAHLMHDPKVTKISVSPLTLTEAQSYLCRLLGVEDIEAHTLRRWHHVSGGNSLSLTLFALTLDRHGFIGRRRGVAFELPGAEQVPTELRDFLHSICSPEELRTLEVIAFAEPVFENVLIRLLDAEQVARLHDLGLIMSSYGPEGRPALTIRHKLLSAAVRAQVSAERAAEVNTLLFEALRGALDGKDPTRSPQILFRLVAMGLEAGRNLPVDWLWEAFEILRSGRELQLRNRIAFAIASHADASTQQFAIAAQQAAWISRLIGDRKSLMLAVRHVERAIERMRRASGVPDTLRVRLYLTLVEHMSRDTGDANGAMALLDETDRRFAESDLQVREAIRAARVQLLARGGRLAEALAMAPDIESFGPMPLEWERASARAVTSLILSQRGQYESSVRLAEYTKLLVQVGEQPQWEQMMLLEFCEFIAFWDSGALESAREFMRECRRRSFDEHYHSGVIDICAVLMSLADGKWRLAAQRSERLIARLGEYDRYGLTAFGNAALALALAALGEREPSRRAIRSAENRQSDFSQKIAGLLRMMTLRARQWNGDEHVAELSLQLASWARSQQLDAIELQALHLLSIEDASGASMYRGRVHALAAEIDLPYAEAMRDHCEELFEGRVAWDSPAARRLTEFGFWMPLPFTEVLSEREREIALFASLGYSSRWIAEQFHLSVRTVDTHLRHVFTKLRVNGRDELRLWFRREHTHV